MGYMADVATLDWTTKNLICFLNQVAKVDSIETIHLVAHSIGNRALLRALTQIMQQKVDGLDWRFGEIVMLAPDVDKDIFIRDYLPELQKINARITLYISSEDIPLMISQEVNQYPRLGDARNKSLIFGNIETVDVSRSSTLFKGHSCYRKESSVLTEMHYLLVEHLGADERPFLQPYESEYGRYWQLEVK